MSLDLEPINELHRKIQEKLSRMLKPSELRIGNNLRPRRVMDPESTPPIGYRICAGHLAYSEEELNHDWEGVAITTDVLSACGFEYNYFDGYTFQHPKGLSYTQPDMKVVNFRGAWIPCKHLHSLQNLFHALFGEELIVKL